ncbi:MAG: GntR family transcriptional regulator [Solirubrobacterales bacterium]
MSKSNGRGPSKSEEAYAMLKGRLLDGTYVPGYRIVINQLVRETGISAIPWREAIRQLEAEGWLEMIRNVGARVATFDTEAYEHTVQVLARLEGYATAAAADRLDATELARARQINQEMIRALEDFDPIRFSSLNRDFHFVFYENCGDDHLCRLISNEWHRLDLIRRTVFSSVPERGRESVQEHEGMLELLEGNESFDEIEGVARQHKLNMLRALHEHEAKVTP